MKSSSGSNDDHESKRQAAAARFDDRIADTQPKTSTDRQGPGSVVTRRTLPSATPSNHSSSKLSAVVTDHDTNVGQSRPSSEAPSSHVTARSSPMGLQKSPGSQQSFKSSLRGNGGSYRNGGTQALMELEDRISFKTGIALDDEESKGDTKKEQDLADSAMPEQAAPRASSSNNNAGNFTAENASKKDTHGAMAKLIGVPPEALAKAAAEKKEAGGVYSSHDGTDPEDPAGKLAVAIAITEDEDDDIIPAAVEYDPDAKPPLIRNRRFRLYSLVACMLMVVVVGAVAGLMAHQKKEQDEPQSTATESPGLETSETGAPTRVGANGIIEQLELIVGSEVLMDPSSPYSRAKDWIIFEDPLQLVALDSNLVQRYVLAVVYFKLHEEGDWVSCNAPSEEEPDDFCLYQKLVNIFPFEYRSIPWYRWLSGNHECNWAGLECDEFEQLRSIELVGQEITGTLPIDFIHFPYLQELSMSWNKLHGTIPSEYGEMRQLLNFELHYNELTGSLPSGWSRFMTMQLFNVAANMLSGSIPEDFFAISSLKGLFLYENMLTGTFPSELSQLSLLSYIRMHRNFFTGTLPSEIGLLSPRELWIHRLPIDGSIPSEIGNLGDILDLRLHTTALTGEIPEEIWNLTKLFRLDLYNTQLSGSLSPSVGQLTDLALLRLRNAAFTGIIPEVLGEMPLLGTLWLDGNDFVGEVPESLCTREAIVELVADCLESATLGAPQVNCTCCHVCCDRDTRVCDNQEV